MKFKTAFLFSFLFIISHFSYADNTSNIIDLKTIDTIISKLNSDSLVIGKNYIFGTKQKIQYSGKYLGQDSVYYKIKTEDKSIKIKKEDLVSYQEQNLENVSFINPKDTLYNFELRDGNDITGYIIKKDSLSYTVRTKSNIVIVIPIKEIGRLNIPKIDYEDGEYFIKDPNDARLFLAPTARPIRKNTGFLSDVELFFPMVGFGIENYVSIVGGVSIIPYSSEQLLYINAKVTPLQTKYVNLAAGYIYFNFTSSTQGLSIGYAGGTFGNKRVAFTTGIGITFKKDTDYSSMFILGGEVRVSDNVKFLTENWIFTYKDAPVMSFFGTRFFGSKIAADFALIKIWDKHTSSSSWPLFPYLSFTYNLDFN